MLDAHSPAVARRRPHRHQPIAAAPARPADPGLLEAYARALEESGAYRVMRRLAPQAPSPAFQAPNARLALMVDCETTGLDPVGDEVIELAVVPFQYGPSGRIIAVHAPVSQLRQPSRPIPPHVTDLTGIDDDAVHGRAVDEGALLPLIARTSLVIAHNSSFDRPFLERLLPAFEGVPWGCSMSQVPWREEGIRALGLAAIAAASGFFYDAHRAADDCLAAIELLGRPLPSSGRSALAELLRRAAADTVRVWAAGAPFAARGLLRARGYHWSNGSGGRPRCWHADLEPERLEAELSFLHEEVGLDPASIPVTRLTALDRFSARG